MAENTNMEIYNRVRAVPDEAKKTIQAGRLKGFTDINPMWRLKQLTEVFGPVGRGWYYEILEERLEPASNGEVAAFTKINLFIKYDDEWSKPIVGIGGSKFIANESKGPFVSDECFKMALTDAISVAAKSLGVGADVYYEKDRGKYDSLEDDKTPSKGATPNGSKPAGNNKPTENTNASNLTDKQIKRLYAIAKSANIDSEKVKEQVKTKFNKEVPMLTKAEYDAVCSGYKSLKK